MQRRLLIQRRPGEARAILLEEGVPVDVRVERDADGSLVDALFWARILRVVPSLPGAFIELGLDRPAFLAGDRLPGGAALVEGAALLVQVTKDAREDKAPEVTAAPSITGTLAVWTPARPGLAVSRSMAPAERARLSGLLADLVQADEGVVLRSHAVGAERAALAEDIAHLRARYAALQATIADAKPPLRLDITKGPVERILEAFDARALDEICLDDRLSFAAAKARLGDQVRLEAPGMLAREGLDGLFDQALSPRLALPGGGELVIETTRAATLVDVNMAAATGNRGKASDAVLRLNLAAARATAEALRLRNIAGSIIIDFVSMANREHRAAVEAAFLAAAEADPMKIASHGWTRLGHLEVTRQRGRPSLADLLLVPPGDRPAKSGRTVALELLADLAVLPYGPGRIELILHPSIARELKGPLAKALEQAALEAGRPIALALDATRAPEAYELLSVVK